MIAHDHLGFDIKFRDIEKGVFIPKYYNPEIEERLHALSKTHDLVLLNDLIESSDVALSTGNEIGKMAYGTGTIPFIRTSDISNWEIKTDPKHSVSEEIHDEYRVGQDIKAGDIFFVKDGTYLIGQSCFISKYDLPCLYQSHIYKIRVKRNGSINRYLLFAGLNAPIVKDQIKAKQFTADIIDTIGHRIRELVLPIPKSPKLKKRIIQKTQKVIRERGDLREKIRRVPLLAEGITRSLDDDFPATIFEYGSRDSNTGFKISLHDIKNKAFMPKYYDPELTDYLKKLQKTHNIVTLGKLVEDGIVSWETGIEVGKMAYGTGHIPFIRTSDMANWEIKTDPKHAVSEDIYAVNKQNVKAEDIFVVRDGTYLVGSSCMITNVDEKILYCGGLYKLRVKKKKVISPYLLLALLNAPVLRRQMRSKQFTRDIIDTIGKRLFEVKLPIPTGDLKDKITTLTKTIMRKRVRLRNHVKSIPYELEAT